MRKVIIFICCIFCFLSCGKEASSASLQEIEAQLTKLNTLEANFEQVKKLQGRNRPLKSEGKVYLDRKKGVYWDQIKPFNQKVILTNNLVQMAVEEDPVTVISESNNPDIFQFISLLKNFITGNIKLLEQSFDLKIIKTTGKHWEISAVPIDPLLKRAFSYISIRGEQSIDQILLYEKSGDSTEITFRNQQINKNAPDEVKRALSESE